MNIEFYSNHMESLSDLMKIAEKHNCTITFGFMSHSDGDIDEDVLKKNGFTTELLEELNDKMKVNDSGSTFDKVWFQLYEKDTETYHTMTYIESSASVIVEKLDEYEFRYDDEEPSDDLIAKLEEHDHLLDYGAYTINVHYNPTIINGFGNEKRVEDFRVYRSGMALKFFGDLVCDYLNEPRIKRVY